MNTHLITPQEIVSLQDSNVLRWEKTGVKLEAQGFLKLAEENHAFNFKLWHAEDRARRDDKGHEFVYLAKREIDACNQARNNRMEAMDAWIFTQYAPSDAKDCPLNSETPGMMVDRLSILALKAYYMGRQATRSDVEEAHQVLCRQKFQTILQQRNQLLLCLEQFLQEISAKTRSFKVYHQFKMYNDPNLNPQLYASLGRS